MNLRPPGPQPGALPDCATPRVGDRTSLTGTLPSEARCEHMFVSRDRLGGAHAAASQAARRLRLATYGARSARHLLPAMPLGVREGALRREPAALHRPGAAREAGVCAGADAVLLEYFASTPAPIAARRTRWCSSSTTSRDKAFNIGARSSATGRRSWTRSRSARSSARTATAGDGAATGTREPTIGSPTDAPIERATGLEPAPRAWKALVRPLHHARERPGMIVLQARSARAVHSAYGPRGRTCEVDPPARRGRATAGAERGVAFGVAAIGVGLLSSSSRCSRSRASRAPGRTRSVSSTTAARSTRRPSAS